MAQYEHLPIYKQAMDLAVYIEKIVCGFSRYHKYALGSELRSLSRNLVKLIIRANSTKDKLLVLLELRENIEELKTCIRIGKELQVFKNFNSFTHAVEQVIMLGRQNEGWIKSQNNAKVPQ
jgi:hypothetical protein